MEDTRGAGRPQFSIKLDDEDLSEVDRIARERRASRAQVIREFVVEGIARHRKRELAEATVGAAS